MKKQLKSVDGVKSSNASTVTNTLPCVEIPDATQTKGKVSAKLNILQQNEQEEKEEKIDKNQLFSVDLSTYFCPVFFDVTALESSLQPLVSSGILSEDAKQAAINKAQKEFLEAHSQEIAASQGLTFAQIVEKLKENETLYKKVLKACKVSELKESEYIEDGKVKIYRAAQCQDKDGTNKYEDVTLSHEENGKKFTVSLFVEKREITTNNILLAIRYNQSKQDAAKRLFNQIRDYRKILSFVFEAAKKAKENGFSLDDVTEQVTKAFNENEN